MSNHRVEQMRGEVESIFNYKLPKHQVKFYQQMMIGEYLKNHPSTLINGGQKVDFLDGETFLNHYNRIIIGAHGPYVEFEKEHLLVDIYVPVREQYRLDGMYSVKYHTYNPINRDEKIYYQIKTVNYADYEVGKYYIDFYLTSLCKINKQ